MSITLNAKGTSVPNFTIGKNGTTIFQGVADPSQTVTPKSNDIWFDKNNLSIKTWSTTNTKWVAPRLADINFDGTTISAITDSDLILNAGTGKNVVLNSAGNTGLTSSIGSDISIIPGIGGNLYINGMKFPFNTGTTGQVLTVSNNSELTFATPAAPIIEPLWILSGSTTPGSTTSILTRRSDSQQPSTEITLPANSGASVRLFIQGYANDNSMHISAESVVLVSQTGASAPVVTIASNQVYSGHYLYTLTCTGIVVNSVPYVRITVTADGDAAFKTLTWSAHAEVCSTAVI